MFVILFALLLFAVFCVVWVSLGASLHRKVCSIYGTTSDATLFMLWGIISLVAVAFVLTKTYEALSALSV